jgi:cell shape-determining protein MreD
MNWFNTLALLVVSYLVVFCQATFSSLRQALGVQLDLLPGLVVYASLSSGIVTVTLVSICGGLWMDSLSANPLGISVLPLFLIGLLIQRNREMILRDEPFAQFVLGAAGSAAASLLTVLLIVNTIAQPLVGWFSLWQWTVLSVIGGTMTPVWFWFFDWVGQALNYRPLGESSFRPDREIKRGR